MANRNEESCVQGNADEQRILIRDLNDKLRCKHIGGELFVTNGLCQISDGKLPRILKAITEFDDFTEENDPYGEHDFGTLEFEGDRVFWKIDYYDRNMEYGSPDPADASVTKRVMTVMLASEY